jgi:hypothetical protein
LQDMKANGLGSAKNSLSASIKLSSRSPSIP